MADRVRELENSRNEAVAKVSLKVDLKRSKNSIKPHYPENVSNPNVFEEWGKGSKDGKSLGHANARTLKKKFKKACDTKVKKRRENVYEKG